jgi:hypothetical protein
VRAEGVSFLFRHKLEKVEGNEDALALYPRIEGFADPPLLEPPRPSNPDDLWSFELNDVIAKVEELWFMTYRYTGPAEATGGFQLVPYHNLEVGPAHLGLFSGVLHSGPEKLLSPKLDGSIELSLTPVNPEALTGMTAFAPISAAVHLTARFVDLSPVNLYLADDGKTKAMDGAGDLDVAATLKNGKLAPGSSITYDTVTPFRLEHVSLTAIASMHLSVRVDGDWSANLGFSSERLELSPSTGEGAGQPFAEAERIRATLSFAELDVARPLVFTKARLEAPVVELNHLERVGKMLPNESWKLLGGSATLSAMIELRDDGVAAADIGGDFEALRLGVKQHEAQAYGRLSLSYGGNRNDHSARLNHAEVIFNNVTLRSKNRKTSDWWGSVIADRIQLAGPESLAGTIAVRGKNAEPVLNALDVPDIVRALIPNKPVDALAKLEKRGEVVHLDLVRAQTGSMNVSGEMRRDTNRTAGVFLATGIAIPIGIEFGREDSGVKLFASESWFEERRGSLGRKSM